MDEPRTDAAARDDAATNPSERVARALRLAVELRTNANPAYASKSLGAIEHELDAASRSHTLTTRASNDDSPSASAQRAKLDAAREKLDQLKGFSFHDVNWAALLGDLITILRDLHTVPSTTTTLPAPGADQ